MFIRQVLDLDRLEHENELATNWEGQISVENTAALIAELRASRKVVGAVQEIVELWDKGTFFEDQTLRAALTEYHSLVNDMREKG